MSGLTLVLGILSTTFITFLFFKWFLQNRGKRYPKGPMGFPIIGHLPFFGSHPPSTFMKWRESYGDVFSIRLGSWQAVVVNGYKAVKAAAEHPNDAFSGRPNFVSMEVAAELINEETFAFGNFTPVYLKQRKLTSKALRLFTFKRSDVIEELVTNEANAFADALIRKYSTTPGYIELDVQILVTRIIYQFLYGRGKHVDVDRHVKTIINLLDEINEFSGSGSAIDVLPWLRYIMPGKIEAFRKLATESVGLMREQIQEHYESFSADDIRDVTDAIIASDAEDEENKDKHMLTRARLNLTLADLQGAGVDTTNKTLSWLLLYMTKFPHIQERVFAEIDTVVGKFRNVQLKDKPDLVYTNAVILEVARTVTQLPFSLPHFSMKDAKIEGLDVDKDTVVIFNLYSVHHEKEFWGDPECFRPERFILDDNTLDSDKSNHIVAFGLGRRRCVGEFLAKMNVFLAFSNIMQKCKFVRPPGERLDLTPIPGLVYTSKNFKVLVQERSSSL
ncbi:cytochrome P450 1A1-like [Mercenaria mercenaria]|uniref:cytochrome P450 1A1-like n=1 Tax=Mercenaria mercenaria TaxID=6596 RepID=UPI00234F9EEB|nr:cytochrome P450 1A1-like [Mercenaria mercenaria]